ncbi:MAG: hypothetical protein AAB792_00085 [Patescibacteria group bacterium]
MYFPAYNFRGSAGVKEKSARIMSEQNFKYSLLEEDELEEKKGEGTGEEVVSPGQEEGEGAEEVPEEPAA